MKYIALLRGINVGGKNKVSMAQLKTLFENSGFADVVTYINSGNVIFTSDIADTSELKSICDSFLTANFPFAIPVMIISAKNLCEAVDHAPDWWNLDENSSHNAIFVIPPATVEDVFEAVGQAKPEYESVAFHGKVIFWSAPRTTFGRTRFSKISATPIYTSITIRNANTAIKLAGLVR